MMNRVKTESEIQALRTSGRMLAAVLAKLQAQVAPGVTGRMLAQSARQELKQLGGEPAFLGYQGFPDVICISINNEIVHGIPDDRPLAAGDLVGLDFGVNYGGMITDGAVTVAVGNPSKEAARLLEFTQRALQAGIDQATQSSRVGDISAAVEAVLRGAGLGVVEDLVGHGVGHSLHEDPQIPNYGTKGTGMALKAGMTIAIEPMATLGGHQVKVAPDGWTVKTADGSLAAQFEHTVLVTPSGAEILTQL